MDTYYNYALTNSNVVTPPYQINKGLNDKQEQRDLLSAQLNISNQVIPTHVTDISYAYRSNATQFIPQQFNTKDQLYPPDLYYKFKGFSFNQVPFLFLQDHRKDYKSAVDDMNRGLQSVSDLSEKFFSESNIKFIQKKLTSEINKITKGKVIIEDQPYLDVLVYMQNAYYTHGRFLYYDIDKQVNELNYITVKELLPEIITQIKQQLGYIRDISYPPPVLPLPANVNKAGRKTNRSLSSILENS